SPTCVFPHCTKPSRGCDLDHLIPWAEGGQTTEANLAPVCRHHHRLKTHSGWRYQSLAPGTFLWHEPHGQRFITAPTGTIDLS
ncbi:MAG: HNH endonuclease signature motif containing protein, partial [Nocardioides sp.]